MDWKIYTSLELFLVIFHTIAALPVSTSGSEPQNEFVFNKAETTEIQVTRLRYTWTINNFHLDDFTNHQTFNSSKFSAEPNDGCQWNLMLSPKGYSSRYKENVSLFIVANSCNVTANVRLGFINASNEESNAKELFRNFTESNIWGFNSFITQDFLFNEDNGVLVNSTLTIFCEVKIISTGENSLGKPNQLPRKDDVGKDLASLLDNKLFSDVIISAGGKDFPALKGILAARSPVFKDIIENNTQEGKIDVPDMSDDVLKEMLRYIYTSEVLNLKDLAPSLLAAAEKYRLDGLKTLCENYLSENLTIENVFDFYTLGDMYSAAFLKDQAKDFIAAHSADIILTSLDKFKSEHQKDARILDGIFSNTN